MEIESKIKKDVQPPRISRWIFKRFLARYNQDTSLGDLEEEFFLNVDESGLYSARRWYRQQVLKSIPWCLNHAIRSHADMIVNYIKIALRNLKRYKIYSLINILGLAVGISACILIYLFVMDELSFDKFHAHGDRLFRVMRVDYQSETGERRGASPYLPPAMGPEMDLQLDEIESMSRTMWGHGVVRYQDKVFRENLYLVDAPFFTMFTFPFVFGHPEAAFAQENNIVLTRSTAVSYFGDEDPVGRVMYVSFGEEQIDFIVSGVTEDVPRHSSIQFKMVIPINHLARMDNNPVVLEDWHRWYFPFYVRLREGATVDRVEARLSGFADQFFSDTMDRVRQSGWVGERPFSFGLQSIEDVYIETRGLTPSLILSILNLHSISPLDGTKSPCFESPS